MKWRHWKRLLGRSKEVLNLTNLSSIHKKENEDLILFSSTCLIVFGRAEKRKKRCKYVIWCFMNLFFTNNDSVLSLYSFVLNLMWGEGGGSNYTFWFFSPSKIFYNDTPILQKFKQKTHIPGIILDKKYIENQQLSTNSNIYKIDHFIMSHPHIFWNFPNSSFLYGSDLI